MRELIYLYPLLHFSIFMASTFSQGFAISPPSPCHIPKLPSNTLTNRSDVTHTPCSRTACSSAEHMKEAALELQDISSSAESNFSA
jgi:hypothetical protein